MSELEDIELEKEGRVPVFLDAAQRLVKMLAGEHIIAAVVTGPITLASNLIGQSIENKIKENSKESIDILDFAGRIVLKMVKSYCDLKVDIIIVVEQDQLNMNDDNYNKYKESLNSIWNLVRFYEIHPLLFFISGRDSNDYRRAFELRADGMAFGWLSNPSPIHELALEYKQTYALCIPPIVMNGELEVLRKFVSDRKEYLQGKLKDGCFITTQGELPTLTPPGNVKKLMSIVKELGDEVSS